MNPTLATIRTSLALLRALALCACLAPIGLAVPLHRAWHYMATSSEKPRYHSVVMTGLEDPMPWSLWATCGLFFVLAFVLQTRAVGEGVSALRSSSGQRRLVQHTAVRLGTCLGLVLLPILLALRHADPKMRFTNVQGYWTTFAGPHEYAPIFLAAAAVILVHTLQTRAAVGVRAPAGVTTGTSVACGSAR
jgi:hypothetical protein